MLLTFKQIARLALAMDEGRNVIRQNEGSGELIKIRTTIQLSYALYYRNKLKIESIDLSRSGTAFDFQHLKDSYTPYEKTHDLICNGKVVITLEEVLKHVKKFDDQLWSVTLKTNLEKE